jgi:hypothetical protein
MTQETNASPRRGLILAAAATALTVAAGLTAGALLGYVGPARTSPVSATSSEAAQQPLATLDPPPAVNASFADGSGSPRNAGVEPPPAESAQGEPAQADPSPAPEAARGEAEQERGERHHEGREHGRREREREDDDD